MRRFITKKNQFSRSPKKVYNPTVATKPQQEAKEEVKKIIDKAYMTARQILTANADKLHIVAQILLEREKIDGEEFNQIFEQ